MQHPELKQHLNINFEAFKKAHRAALDNHFKTTSNKGTLREQSTQRLTA